MSYAARYQAHPRPWHRNSVFGDGRQVPLDRERRARFRYLVHAHTRAGRLTPKGEWVILELEQHLSRTGRCDPSHARLAANAHVEISTVQRSLNTARELGLVMWQRRLVRVGWRVAQTSNAYVLDPGGAAPMLRAYPLAAQPRHSVSPLNLESGFSGGLHFAANSGVSADAAAVLAGQGERIRAKIAAERAERAARLAAWQGNRVGDSAR